MNKWPLDTIRDCFWKFWIMKKRLLMCSLKNVQKQLQKKIFKQHFRKQQSRIIKMAML